MLFVALFYHSSGQPSMMPHPCDEARETLPPRLHRAREIIAGAEHTAREVRAGADEYAKEVLSNLESFTSRMIGTIQRGREKLEQRDTSQAEEFIGPDMGGRRDRGIRR